MLHLKMFVLYLEATDILCGMEDWDLREAQKASSKREGSKYKSLGVGPATGVWVEGGFNGEGKGHFALYAVSNGMR